MFIRRERLKFGDSVNIYLLFLIGMFFFAQLFYHFIHAGYFPSSTGIDGFIVDMGSIFWKKGHYWQSIFYYHLYPPLYILYASFFYLLNPPHGELGFYCLHTILGVSAIYCLFKIQIKIGINPILATFLISVYVLNPSFNFSETNSIYDFPVACLMIISAWRLLVLLDRPRFSTAFTFFFVIALICNLRTLYHVWIYFIPLVVFIIIALRKNWKMILLSSLIPFLMVFSIYFKNYILYHEFMTTSYFGETFDSIMMQFYVNLQQREEGVKKGFFTDLAYCPSVAEGSFKPTATSKYSGYYCYTVLANKYREAYIKRLGTNYSDVPLLSCTPIEVRPGIFLARRSCLGNIAMDKEYEKNNIQAIIHYPGAYWNGIKAAWRQYFNTSASYYYEIMNRKLPISLSKSWLRLPFMGIPDLRLSFSIPLLIIFPLLLFFAVSYILYSKKGFLCSLVIYSIAFVITTHLVTAALAPSLTFILYYSWPMQDSLIMWVLGFLIVMIASITILRVALSFLQKKISNINIKNFINSFINSDPDYSKKILVLFMLGNIIYTSILITLLVGFAQQRYRFYVDSFYLILFALFIQTIFFKKVGENKISHLIK